MKLGVAMATWNGASFVADQLESIARQSRRADHLVVADDGSDDGTVERVKTVCAEHALPLDLLEGGQRLGATANFERAIAAVDADVVVLCDQDDVWRSDKLAVIEDAFARRAEADGVFSDARIIDDAGRPSGKTLWRSFGYDGDADLLPVLLKKNVVTGATLAFRASQRDLLLPIGRDGWHDVWIALLLAAAGELVPLPDTLVDYRLHGQNAEGLGTRSVGGAVAQRAEGRKPRELRQFEALVARLRERRGSDAASIAAIEAKVEHLRHRCALPANPLLRASRIARLVPEYSRFSSSWRSPLLDLVAPAGDA